MGGDNSEIERAWLYLRTQQINHLPLLAIYGRKYKRHLTDESTLDDVHQYKSQLKLFSPEIITVVELLAECDIINQLKYQKQDYSYLSQKLKHLYDDKFWYIHSYQKSRISLDSFIFYLNELIKNKSVHNQNKKASLLLGFHLALDLYNKYFIDRQDLH